MPKYMATLCADYRGFKKFPIEAADDDDATRKALALKWPESTEVLFTDENQPVGDQQIILDLLDDKGGIEREISTIDACEGAFDRHKLLQLVQQLARMTTPYDEMDERKKEYARDNGLKVEDVGEDEIIADYSGDDSYNDAQALWGMIDAARDIVGKPKPEELEPRDSSH